LDETYYEEEKQTTQVIDVHDHVIYNDGWRPDLEYNDQELGLINT
jgi:hypothetical protein